MKGLGTVTVLTLSLLVHSSSVPQDQFRRRNWTPQAMLYLKGAQGRRFIADDGKDSDLFENIDIETRSQTARPLTLLETKALFLAAIKQAEKASSKCARISEFYHAEIRKRKVKQ